ncbi:Alpha/Beta hydrolase protein [Cladorrhinum sp. PSN332]|nr:Alpha/Beta hydrolase protein [Cladorrhinum sp. PSN332]
MGFYKKFVLLAAVISILTLLHRLNVISLPFFLRLPFLSSHPADEQDKIPPTHHFILPSSGRQVAYSVYNPSLTSKTAFYLHGTPSSHYEAFLLASAARKSGLRVIALSRPGFGGSTFHENATLLDYPVDILSLADYLNVKRFGIIAVSGGTPFAFACRKVIPRERLVGMGIVAGIYPTKSLGTEGMKMGSRVMLKVATWFPGLVEWAINQQVGKIAEDEKKVEEMLVQEMEGSAQKEYEKEMWEKSSEEMRRAVVMSVREGVRYGGKGAAWEMRLLGSDWGFELDDDEVMPKSRGELVMWHGDGDENVPVEMARRASERLGDKADLRIVEGQGHGTLTMFKADEIVKTVAEMLRG